MTTATQRSQFLRLLFIGSASMPDFSIPEIFQCADLNFMFPHTGFLRAAAAEADERERLFSHSQGRSGAGFMQIGQIFPFCMLGA